MRTCHLPLDRVEHAWRCTRGHSFDIARSGYVNLLQPQDRKSATPGDTKDALEARERLLTGGVGCQILEAVIAQARHASVVVDLGCGTGDVLGTLAPPIGIGIDLAVAGIARAARRWSSADREGSRRHVVWVVANADRRLPILDGSADLVLSIHARRNPSECARVLRDGGRLIVAVPADDDLIELRAHVQGEGRPVPRGDAVLTEHTGRFELLDRRVVRERHRLERPQLLDLLRGTYRGNRASATAAIASLNALDVTVASETFEFVSAPGASRACGARVQQRTD